MQIKQYTYIFLLVMLFLGSYVQAQAGRKKKKSGSDFAITQENSRSVANTASRKTADPFGFLKGGDQHRKNKNCGCPGTKKGERQRRKEFRSHRNRK